MGLILFGIRRNCVFQLVCVYVCVCICGFMQPQHMTKNSQHRTTDAQNNADSVIEFQTFIGINTAMRDERNVRRLFKNMKRKII